MFCLSVKTVSRISVVSTVVCPQSLTQGKTQTITMTGKSLFLLEGENRTLEQWEVLDSKVIFYSVCKCKQTNENVKYKGKVGL